MTLSRDTVSHRTRLHVSFHHTIQVLWIWWTAAAISRLQMIFTGSAAVTCIFHAPLVIQIRRVFQNYEELTIEIILLTILCSIVGKEDIKVLVRLLYVEDWSAELPHALHYFPSFSYTHPFLILKDFEARISLYSCLHMMAQLGNGNSGCP